MKINDIQKWDQEKINLQWFKYEFQARVLDPHFRFLDLLNKKSFH